MKKQVVVVGLGRFGSSVATSLYNLGHDVLAMDKDEAKVQNMMGQATHALTGNATDEHVFRELGIPDYDVAIVAIGSDMVSSVMASVLLKTMGVPYIVARAHDELHGNTLERIGVDRVVHAESEMGVRLAHTLFNPNVKEYLELTPNFGISKILVPNRYDEMSLKELGFSSPRDKYGLAVLAIRRGKEITLNPDGDDRLRAGDELVLAGRDDLLDSLDT
ncbi:MAG: TrkA family potassium uptake protein [Chloroflexi bacterium]|nr:TrkA family potassium uptake protein [Chloroflexota bacterium]MCH9038657.1 TrkA family potassium uptake protein [Chloroflexota bacterium]MCI0770560.1 TrkA family potassium uptake protein [Chloroflexota bacterium]MCI0790147.1 TrkA family potassium uptake protein [Chloroflexota bacterium]MCI0795437.1 TrkA family potassium uptake protein [Chloroflexota bacterium]